MVQPELEAQLQQILNEVHERYGSGLPKPPLVFDYRRTRGGRTTKLGHYSVKTKAIHFLMNNVTNTNPSKYEAMVKHEFAHYLQWHDPMGHGPAHGHVFKKYARVLGLDGKATIKTVPQEVFTTFTPRQPVAPQPLQPPQLNPVTASLRNLWQKTRIQTPSSESYMNPGNQ